MLRNMHLLMALPTDRGAITFAAKKAEHLPVEGIRIYFPSGHVNRLDKIAYWLKRRQILYLGFVPRKASGRSILQG